MIDEIVSAILLIILVETLSLILPEGKTNGILKWSLSLIITVALITPIFSVLTNDFSKKQTYQTQGNYLISANEIVIEYDKEFLKQNLDDLGFDNVDISVSYGIEKNQLKYNSVTLTFVNLTTFDSTTKTNIINKVKSIFGEVKVIIND